MSRRWNQRDRQHRRDVLKLSEPYAEEGDDMERGENDMENGFEGGMMAEDAMEESVYGGEKEKREAEIIAEVGTWKLKGANVMKPLPAKPKEKPKLQVDTEKMELKPKTPAKEYLLPTPKLPDMALHLSPWRLSSELHGVKFSFSNIMEGRKSSENTSKKFL